MCSAGTLLECLLYYQCVHPLRRAFILPATSALLYVLLVTKLAQCKSRTVSFIIPFHCHLLFACGELLFKKTMVINISFVYHNSLNEKHIIIFRNKL